MTVSINYHTILTIVGLSIWIIEASENTSHGQPSYSFADFNGNHENKNKHIIGNLRNTQLEGVPPFNCSIPQLNQV